MGKKQRTIYFVFTDTGTFLSRIINFFTNKTLNHVSISLDSTLTDLYSFGRKNPKNPFSGGFVKEDIRGIFLKDAACVIYSFNLSESEFRCLTNYIKQFESEKEYYKYNFIGLIGVLLNIEIHRKRALFCSQFAATVMRDVPSFRIEKPACFVTPSDIRNHPGMIKIYEGKLGNYKKAGVQVERVIVNEDSAKHPVLFTITKIVKQFVIR